MHALIRCLERAGGLFAVALACILPVAAPSVSAQSSFAPDRSDLYGTAGEPGWGLQLTQQGNAYFATMLVHGPAGQGIFLTATLAAGGDLALTGDVFRTHGPWFGSPSYNPALVTAVKAGTMRIAWTSGDTATLDYTIDGATVRKAISRQQLQQDDYTGAYVATVYVVTTHCSNSGDNGARVGSFDVGIAQTGTDITITTGFARRGTSRCTYSGTYMQAGRSGAVGSGFACSDGDEGSMSFFEMSKRPGMFSGWFQGHSITDSCDYSGTITGLIPR